MTKIDDLEFEPKEITNVRTEKDGWVITTDGWSFFVPDKGVEPKVGQTATFYGKGIGHTVRGLDIDGQEIFYRTPDEDKEYQEIEMYGNDAADWLSRWDSGRGVWSIEMGGLGPGYEQCIHITCAEMLRLFLAEKYNFEQIKADGKWEETRKQIDKEMFANPIVSELGLSGAQYGAAMNIAGQLYRKGPRGVMNDEAVKDRHIQVSKNFPQATASKVDAA